MCAQSVFFVYFVHSVFFDLWLFLLKAVVFNACLI